MGSILQNRPLIRSHAAHSGGITFGDGYQDFMANEQRGRRLGIHPEPIAFELEHGDERSECRGGPPHDYLADGEPESVLSSARSVTPAEAGKRPANHGGDRSSHSCSEG